MAEKIPGWFERLLLPRLSALEGEIRAIRGEMKGEIQGMKGEIQGMKGEIQGMKGEIQGMKGEIQGLRSDIKKVEDTVKIELRRLDERISGIETKMDLVREVEAIKARLDKLEARAS
jgi:predicted  nucleic acid-binding Zn-ribbon protein